MGSFFFHFFFMYSDIPTWTCRYSLFRLNRYSKWRGQVMCPSRWNPPPYLCFFDAVLWWRCAVALRYTGLILRICQYIWVKLRRHLPKKGILYNRMLSTCSINRGITISTALQIPNVCAALVHAHMINKRWCLIFWDLHKLGSATLGTRVKLYTCNFKTN